MFRRKKKRLWTWKTPNNMHFNEIDFILTNKPNQIKEFDVINTNFYTDHRMVRCRLVTKTARKITRNPPPALRIIPELPEEKLEELNEKFVSTIDKSDDLHAQYRHLKEQLTSVMQDMTIERKKAKTGISEHTKKLLERRKILYKEKNTRENRKEITKISKEINRNIAKDKKQYRQEILEKHIKKSGAIKKAFKELTEKKEWTASIRTKKNTIVSKRPIIIQEATKFYEDLYNTTHTPNLDIDNNNLEPLTVPNILTSEIKHAIMTQKDDKATGEDCITNEFLKALSDPLLSPLQKIFDNILKKGTTPEEWSKSTTILLHKKGDRRELSNYRPISLMSNIYKIFSKIILKRITPTLDQNQSEEQAGFRKGYSTVDHIQVVTTIISRYTEYNKILYIGFIDYTKAFDSLEYNSIWQALREQGVEEEYINVLHNIYSKSSAKIRMERDGPEFAVKKGVRQGDPMSPKIFCAVLEMIFRNIDWQDEGININGEQLSHLRFADDIAIFAETPQKIESMIIDLARESKKVGLSLNPSKTKIMTNGRRAKVTVDNEDIEYVTEYTYLGQSMAFKDLTEKEVDRRIGLAWKKYWSLKEIMKCKDIDIAIKSKVYNIAILPCLIYGCQTWALRKEEEKKLAICQRKMERSMLGIRLSDRISNKKIRQKTKLRDIVKTIRTLKWNWAGHVCRMKNDRWTKKVIEWIPRSDSRKRGRPYRRWEDVFAQRHGQEWKRLARDRIQWTKLGEAYAREATDVLNLTLPKHID